MVILLIFSLKRFFRSLGQHWFGIVMLLHATTFIIQMSMILPFEIALAGHLVYLVGLRFHFQIRPGWSFRSYCRYAAPLSDSPGFAFAFIL